MEGVCPWGGRMLLGDLCFPDPFLLLLPLISEHHEVSCSAPAQSPHLGARNCKQNKLYLYYTVLADILHSDKKEFNTYQ